jgi:hypothetical protein
MKNERWWKVAGVALLGLGLTICPGPAMAADTDADGIDDTREIPGGAGVTFDGVPYPPCGTVQPGTAARNACVSPNSKDIFIYFVDLTGGFLATNNLGTPELLFQFITAPNTATGQRGKVFGLGVGVHVRFKNAEVPTENRLVVGNQKAVQIIADGLANSAVFGRADVGTPTNTGNATVYPVTIKNYVNSLKGGGDNPSDWKPFIQRTFSHELSHVAALVALSTERFGGNHYSSGRGVVMDQSVVYNSKNRTFTIYSDYASGDTPCLGVVNTANPLGCLPLP